MIWLYILGGLVGYFVFMLSTYILGTWLDDVMSEGKVKDFILTSIVITWLPGVFVYVIWMRSIFLQRWLLVGCESSRNELLSDLD